MDIFVRTEKSDKKSFSRKLAKGYNELCLDLDSNFAPYIINADDAGRKLVVNKDESVEEIIDSEINSYLFIVKEFALVPNVLSKVSIILLDDGYMAVKLKEGGILVRSYIEKEEGTIVLPYLGIDEPSVCAEDCVWLNADDIKTYPKYYGDVVKTFMNDIELSFVMTGSMQDTTRNLKVSRVKDEEIDLSLGAIVNYLTLKKEKEEKKVNDALQKQFSFENESDGLEFDDDEEDEEEDEFELDEDWD